MALSRSLLNLQRWKGSKPNVLVGGRVDARLGAIADGLIGIKSIQSGSFRAVGASQTLVVNSVVMNKSILIAHSENGLQGRYSSRLTSSTEITTTRRVAGGDSTETWLLLEFY